MLITIRNGEAVLETVYCKTEHDAQGQLVAFHIGRYYVVDEARSIDLSGLSLTADELLVSPPLLGEALIEGDIETYLFISGSAAVFENRLHQTKVAGGRVLREGRYLGADVNGFQPDWIIKIATPTGGFSSLGLDFPRAAAAVTQQRTESDVRISLLNRENIRLRDELGQENQRLREELGQENQRLLEELDRVRAERSKERAAEESREAADPASAPEHTPLQFLPLPEPPQPLPRAPVVQPTGARHKILMQEIQSVMTALCPHARLIRASLERLAVEVSDRRAFYAALRELGEPPLGSNWKKLKGVEGWFERHVSDGRSDAGRIYARRDSGGWDVLFGHKGEQSNDIAWLASR